MNLFKQCITAVTLLLSLQTIAQEKSKRLYVGDKVPDLEFKGMYNYPTQTAKLSDFKGKTVILDIWNKYCTSCIAAFPKLQKIQEEFKDDLVILLINDQPDQTRENLNPLFEKSPILQSTTLPMVLGDKSYGNNSQFFPHWGVSYHIWIDKHGIIKATTHGYEATRENIQRLIKGMPLNVVERKDILEKRDNRTSWLSINNGQFINKLIYYKSGNLIYKHSNKDIDLGPLTEIRLGEKYHSLLMMDPVIGNLAGSASPSQLLYNQEGKEIGRWVKGAFNRQYAIAYNSILPLVVDENLRWNLKDQFIYEYTDSNFTDSLCNEVHREFLEEYFGYKGVIEIRPFTSYILYRTDGPLKLPLTKGGAKIWENTMSKRGTIFRNQSIRILQSHLSRYSTTDKFGNRALVIDETGIDQATRLDMTLYGGLKNVPNLSNELSKYGLGIKKELRTLPVLVLKKCK